MTHAFFKGLLFLGAGSVIHGMHEEQNMRKMGGLRTLHAYHLLDLPGRVSCQRRRDSLRRVLVEGRDHCGRLARNSVHRARSWRSSADVRLLTALYMFRLVFLVFTGSRGSTRTIFTRTNRRRR